MTLGFGIVGCGGAAVDVARAIDALPETRVVATHDRVAANAEDIAAPRGATVHAELDGLLADSAVDVVYVGLPHDLLTPTAARALGADRHVLVEKPMALTVADIRSLQRLAEARARRLGVMFELRCVAAIEAARDLIRAGAIGEVRSVRIQAVIDKPATYWASGPTGRVADDWRANRDRAGGGVVLMNAIHQLDLVRWMTGTSFVSVAAQIGELEPGVEVEDRAAAALRLQGGAIVSLTATAHSPGADGQERIEVDGTLGRLDLPDPYTTEPSRAYVREPRAGLAAGRIQLIDPPAVDSFVAFLGRFAAAIANGLPLPADADDAASALATVLAIYEAAATGREVPIETFDSSSEA